MENESNEKVNVQLKAEQEQEARSEELGAEGQNGGLTTNLSNLRELIEQARSLFGDFQKCSETGFNLSNQFKTLLSTLNLSPSTSDPVACSDCEELVAQIESLRALVLKLVPESVALTYKEVTGQWGRVETLAHYEPTDPFSYDPDKVRSEIAMSTDGFNAVDRAYLMVFNRIADSSGRKHWMEELAAGRQTYVSLVNRFMQSDERKRIEQAEKFAQEQRSADSDEEEETTEDTDGTDDSERVLYIGNFLWAGETTMTLMSDYLHNGETPSRNMSDIDRLDLILKNIEQLGDYPHKRWHMYGTNDDNYSRRRGGEYWPDKPDRRLFLDFSKPDEVEHWRNWFTRVREEGYKITLWLWPNDARNSFNKASAWSDEAVIAQMASLIEFGLQDYQGEPLCDEFVLKLEADDEWSVERINTIASQVHPHLPSAKAKLYYHNQTTNLEIMKQVAWQHFDGIRFQYGNRSSREEVQRSTLEVLNSLPSHLLFYGSEYSINGHLPEGKQIGDWILELATEQPRIMGVDNGANVEKWS